MLFYNMIFSASVLIIFTILMRAIAMHICPKWLFTGLWKIVMLRLAIPFFFPIKIRQASSIESLYLVHTESSRILVYPAINLSNQVNYLGLVWVLGIMIFGIIFFRKYVREKRILSEAIPLEKDNYAQIFAKQYLRSIKVFTLDRILTPMTYGVIRPRIILPTSVDFNNQREIEMMLLHEIQHIKYRDNFWKIFGVVLVSIYWFNPLIWIMRVLLDQDLELLCDERTVSILGRSRAQEYAGLLLSYAQKNVGTTLVSCNFGAAILKERIVSIMKNKKITIWAVIISALVLISSMSAFAMVRGGKGSTSNTLVQEDANHKLTYFVDGKELTPEEYEAAYPPGDDIEWWTYDDFKAFIEEQKKSFQDMVDHKIEGKTEREGSFIWTQERSDKAIEEYEQELESIKNGAKISRFINGKDDDGRMLESYSAEPIARGYNAEITLPNGETKSIQGCKTKEELIQSVKAYCDEQLKQGKITEENREKIMAGYQ